MKLLKIVPHKWENESRDKRELSVCKELGLDITVLSKNELQKNNCKKIVDGFNVWECSTKPLPDKKCFKLLNKVLSVIRWSKYVRKFNADIISGHDYIAVGIGYLSNLFKKKKNKAKLVYDSHEFELGRNMEEKRNRFKLFFITRIERFLIKKSCFSIMVNDCIADEVQRIYKLKKRPIVVRNIPNFWLLDETQIKLTRNVLCNELKYISNPFIIMYHGYLMKGRGIEILIKALKLTDEVGLVILGNGEDSYKKELLELCSIEGVENRVLFKNAVKIEELYKYVGAADVGMIMIENICKSYYLCLPNKLFENIQSLTPVITSNFPELKKITENYQIGISVDPNNIVKIATSITKMKEDKEFYYQCKSNMISAKNELCWDNEKKILKKAYMDLIKNANVT